VAGDSLQVLFTTIHPAPGSQAGQGRKSPLSRQKRDGGTQIRCSLTRRCSASTSGHTPQPPQPPLRAPTGRNDGPHREKWVRSCSTEEKASSQEPDHGGGGASGMAERPALRGREEPTLIWRPRDSRTPAA